MSKKTKKIVVENSPMLVAGLAGLSLGRGIYSILQPEYNAAVVALGFGAALFCGLISIIIAVLRK